MKSTRALLFVLLASAGGFACKAAPNAPAASPTAQIRPGAQTVPGTPAVAPAQAPQAIVPPPPAFVYNPTGLRDPFEPFVKLEEKKPKEAAPKTTFPRTPLQRYSTDELKLAGIIWGDADKAKALIEDPQGKGYAVGVGTLVGDRGGKIARILPDRIVIEERFKDVLGEEKKNVANMMLHKAEGEVRK